MSSPPQQDSDLPLTPSKDLAQIFTRHDWEALPPLQPPPPLTTPVTRIVTTWANVESCSTVEECKDRVRQVQKIHMESRKLPDIEHNFLIGGDGNIYEGRGWSGIGPVYPSNLAYANDLNGRSVEIAYLDKEGKKPNDIQARATTDCLAYGLIVKFLQEKVQFYFRTSDNIQYISSYQKNSPVTTTPGFGFSDPSLIKGISVGI